MLGDPASREIANQRKDTDRDHPEVPTPNLARYRECEERTVDKDQYVKDIRVRRGGT